MKRYVEFMFDTVTKSANAANIPPYFLNNLSIKDFIISLSFTIIVIFTPLSYHINIYKGKAMVRIMVFLGTKKAVPVSALPYFL